MTDWISPGWPAPGHVHALATTRHGGVSAAPFDSLNLSLGAGDQSAAALDNRSRVQSMGGLPTAPVWLKQVHGVAVVDAGQCAPGVGAQAVVADASFTTAAHVVCAVLTADCLPVLLTDTAGSCVAAVHAGWRGLAAGVIERAVQHLPARPDQLLAWLGPAIGPAAYEVGAEVRDAFLADSAAAATCFDPTRPGHWLADLYALARHRLMGLGVTAIYGGEYCTFRDERFFSYRRDGQTGRQATLIWRSG